MEGHLREALDANVLRQTGDHLEFRHPLLREAAYDDLMPDERTRTHARLAEILQAGVDGDPDPGLATLSRLAFHWNAAHDLPRTLWASVRAGLAAKRLGAAEAVTQLERALSLWDRVPDARAVAGLPQAELVVLLGESAAQQDDGERWRTLIRTAVEMLGPDPDRLLASRVYSALVPASLTGDAIGKQEAIRRAIEYAGDSPTGELARALNARSLYLNRHTQFIASVEAAERAVEAARSAGCVEAEVDALYLASLSPLLPRPHRRRTRGDGTGRGPGTGSGHGRARARRSPVLYMEAGQVDRGLSVANEGFDEGMALGLPVQATLCGGSALVALLWRGRLGEAERRLEELVELGLPTASARWHPPRAELLLARGDTDAAAPVVHETVAFVQDVGRKPVGHRGPDRARARGHARRPARRPRGCSVIPGAARRL